MFSHIFPEFEVLSKQQNTYFKYIQLTGSNSNSTYNIEKLQKLIILEPFYEIRNISGHMCEIINIFSYTSSG